MTKAVTNFLFEKYRPLHVAECVLLPDDRQVFNSFIAKKAAPHILLIGPPGVGKTSMSLALVNDMDWQVRTKNAAAYANIEVVRTEIAPFATPHAELPWLIDPRHPCVFLDEVDHMLKKAQAALRGIMEEAAAADYSNFILAANDGRKVDAAIRSRCSVFDFSYPDPTERAIITAAFRERIVSIAEAEGLKPDAEMIDRCLKRFGLDFRAVLNEIQKHT